MSLAERSESALAVHVARGQMIAARDGVGLVHDLYMPDTTEPVPTILLRTPYDRTALGPLARQVDPLRAAARGFATVVQDVRGSGGSDGSFSVLVGEAGDGGDTIDWIARQPWSDGRVVMAGGSYCGMVQHLTAVAGPPAALRAVAPTFCPTGFEDCWYRGGSLRLGLVAMWIAIASELTYARRSAAGTSTALEREALADVRVASPIERLHELLRPESPLRTLAATVLPIVEHDRYDGYWAQLEVTPRLEALALPGFHVAGWFDALLTPGLAAHQAMVRSGAPQRLIVGPWAHGGLQGQYRDLPTGLQASAESIDLFGRQLAFYSDVLGGDPVGAPPVAAFLLGASRWRTYDRWPPPGAVEERLFLAPNGTLVRRAPDAEACDRYDYDPDRPVPTCGGSTLLESMAVAANAGPRDQREIEARDDVLTYASGVLERDVELAGPVELRLFASTSAVDTDFMVKLTDVHPDGRTIGICDGVLRASFRDGVGDPRPMIPERIEEYRIPLASTHYALGRGHRLGLQIMSSSVPEHYPNPNTGHRLRDGAPPRRVVARQRILHGGGCCSSIAITTMGALHG